MLTEFALEHDSQIIAASHSEVILNEAAERDVVIAFLGVPHRIDDRGSQLLKSLRSIGFEQYAQAEQKGWVLYLEGSTDLAILQAFAEKLQHPAKDILKRPYVHYVENQPQDAANTFMDCGRRRPIWLGSVSSIGLSQNFTRTLNSGSISGNDARLRIISYAKKKS